MSKKKATMTLKDFHGGSIPSDLPLPSAPGVMVRPSDRSGYDRQTSWGNPMGRSDHRLRPGSAGTARNFDDKTPFLSNSSHIGRNFDEDERKPLDGTSGPRRTVSDESLRALPSRVVEPKMEHSAAGRVTSQPVSTPGSQYSSHSGSSFYAGRFNEVNSVGASAQGFVGSTGAGLNSPNVGAPSGQMNSGPYPNAWGVRKEAASGKELAPAAWSAPDAASKLAHASALEKVSSGRWHSKQQLNSPTDIEVIRHPESESEFHFRDNLVYNKNAYNNWDMVGRTDYHDAPLVKQAEKSLNIGDGIRGGSKEIPSYEKARSPVHAEANERNPGDMNGFHPPHPIGKPTVSELHSAVPTSEPSERPKLKLLPRSKPMENLEPPMDYKQVYHQASAPAHAENYNETQGVKNHVKAGFVGSEVGNPIVERPKLNLNPRKEPLAQTEGDSKSRRNTLFGGARPRELVLKDRGVDNVAGKVDDLLQPAYRNVQDSPKTERASVHATPVRYNDKPENIPVEHKMGKNSDRRDNRLDAERSDGQRRNWRSENWVNKREFDKHHQNKQQQQQQLQQDRPPSPETWRRPVEHSKPVSPDASGLRYGKAVSAVELAQAFSKSVSDPATADRFSVQRGVPSRGQIPFSRLMGPSARPQINGY